MLKKKIITVIPLTFFSLKFEYFLCDFKKNNFHIFGYYK